MEPEHPDYVSVKKDLGDINAHMKQLLIEKMPIRAQDITSERDTSDKEEDVLIEPYKEDISVDMETSDKDQEKTKTLLWK